MSPLRSELQWCVRNMCAEIRPHSGRSAQPRKRLASGERARLACWFRRRAETGLQGTSPIWKVRDREDALASTRDARAPQKSDLLPKPRVHIRGQIFVRHQLLLACGHIFHFHLRPFIAEKERHSRAQFFRRLKLAADLRWRERVIDTIPAVAELVDFF